MGGEGVVKCSVLSCRWRRIYSARVKDEEEGA